MTEPYTGLSSRIRGSRFNNLQALRAVAALGVVIYHARDTVFFEGHSDILTCLEVGQAGVDLFFVLSGFLMVFISESKYRSPTSFMMERILRVAPLYWLITAVVSVIALRFPALVRGTHPDTLQLLKSILFIAYEKAPGLVHPIVFVGWTLNYEMFFYAVFSVALGFPRIKYWILSLVITGLVLVGLLSHAVNPVARFYLDPIMAEFLLGVGIGLLYLRPAKLRLHVSVSLSIAALMFLAMFILYEQVTRERLIAFGVPSAIIVWLLLSLDRRGFSLGAGVVSLIGDASYSIYLTHFFVTQAGTKLWSHFSTKAPWLGSLAAEAAVVVTSLAIGVLVYKFVEQPLSGIVRSRRRSRMAGLAAPAKVK